MSKLNVRGQNDVSGRCTVEYEAVKGQVTRTKILETCKAAEGGFTTHSQVSQRPHRRTVLEYSQSLVHQASDVSPLQVLGVSRKSGSVTVFRLQDGFIRSAVAEETHSLAVNARRSAAAKVVSR